MAAAFGVARYRTGGCAGTDWQVDVKHLASLEAVAFQAVPAADHRRRNTQIVGHGLERVVLVHVIYRQPFGVSLRVTSGAPSRCNRDHEPRSAFKFRACIE